MNPKKEQSNNNFLNKTLKSYVQFEEKWADALAKFLTKFFGSLLFLNITFVFILGWMIVNFGVFPNIHPFDTYPFNWLIIFVELFTLFLSIIVLINQNREAKINGIRQQIDFEINVRAEHEITKILHMVQDIQMSLGIAKKDEELEEMKGKININKVKTDVEKVIEENDNTKGVA